MSLYVKETGTPGASTIVFLHGAGTSGWMWEQQTHDLSDFHCLNVDLPGHGKSNHLAWVSLADTADQIAALIESRATNGRAFVVGLSLGAYVTLHLLSRHADRVERAVMSGVTGGPIPNQTLTYLQMQAMSLVMKQRWFVRLQARMLHIPNDTLDAYTEGMLAMTREAFVGVFKEVLPFQLPDGLSRVNVPTLVVAGSEEVQPIRDGVSKIAATMPNAIGCFAPGVHHGWNGEAPELFSAMLRAWFTNTPLPDALAAPALAMA